MRSDIEISEMVRIGLQYFFQAMRPSHFVGMSLMLQWMANDKA